MIEAERAIKSWSDIPGFFRWIDRWVFATLLEAQQDSPLGTLVELGTYQAKSAVIIGSFVRPGERFVALDLFGREDLLDDSTSGVMNRKENRQQYKNLTRQQFEHNYLALHDTLPDLHEGLSTDIVDLVEPGSVRFVHVDAGHMYDQVRQDVINAKRILRPGGIVAFDDYRTEWTPGVSAAVWQAVFCDGLIPLAITPQKMYGVYDEGDLEPYREVLKAFVGSDPTKWWMQEQYVLGRPLLRIKHIQKPAAKVASEPPKKKKKKKTTNAVVTSATPGPKTEPTVKSSANGKPTKAPAKAAPPQHTAVGRVARRLTPRPVRRWVRSQRAAARERGWPKPTKV